MTAYFKNQITVWHEQVLITMICKDEVIVSFLCEYVLYIPIGNPYNEKKKWEYIQKVLGGGQILFSIIVIFIY